MAGIAAAQVLRCSAAPVCQPAVCSPSHSAQYSWYADHPILHGSPDMQVPPFVSTAGRSAVIAVFPGVAVVAQRCISCASKRAQVRSQALRMHTRHALPYSIQRPQESVEALRIAGCQWSFLLLLPTPKNRQRSPLHVHQLAKLRPDKKHRSSYACSLAAHVLQAPLEAGCQLHPGQPHLLPHPLPRQPAAS